MAAVYLTGVSFQLTTIKTRDWRQKTLNTTLLRFYHFYNTIKLAFLWRSAHMGDRQKEAWIEPFNLIHLYSNAIPLKYKETFAVVEELSFYIETAGGEKTLPPTSWTVFTAKLNCACWSIITPFDLGSPGKACQYPATGSPSATHLARPQRLHSEGPGATAASSSCPPGCGGRGSRHRHLLLLHTLEERPSSPRLCVTRRRDRAPRRLSHAPAAASSGPEMWKKCENRSLLWPPPLSHSLSLILVKASRSAWGHWLTFPPMISWCHHKKMGPVKAGQCLLYLKHDSIDGARAEIEFTCTANSIFICMWSSTQHDGRN